MFVSLSPSAGVSSSSPMYVLTIFMCLNITYLFQIQGLHQSFTLANWPRCPGNMSKIELAILPPRDTLALGPCLRIASWLVLFLHLCFSPVTVFCQFYFSNASLPVSPHCCCISPDPHHVLLGFLQQWVNWFPCSNIMFYPTSCQALLRESTFPTFSIMTFPTYKTGHMSLT